MAGERRQIAIYPGIDGVENATYTDSQGITPGVALVRYHAGIGPASEGTLVISDGFGARVIPECLVVDVQEQRGENGFVFTARLLDRRWKWLQFGGISGQYNQLDSHGKLIGWTVRSPTQLAKLCLDAMGEVNYIINMPPGLTGPIETPDYLTPGQLLPPTGTNPPINWYAEPPIQALQRLCDLFGRRIVLNGFTNAVNIVIPGFGASLPEGGESISSIAPGLKRPAKPDKIAVVGAPTKFQCRFRLQAVGEEWDGTYKPINALSYAPKFFTAGQKQIVNVHITKNDSDVGTWTITINGVDFSYTNAAGEGSLVVAQKLAALINKSTAANVQPYVSAAASTGLVEIDGKQDGVPFSYGVSLEVSGTPFPAPTINAELIQAASKGREVVTWEYEPPGVFPNVRATDRLTYTQAVALAQRSVWKMYQLVNLDVRGKGPINVPGYGKIKRRQQIELLATKVDQVVPAPADGTFIQQDGFPLIQNYYTGYSRDKPGEVFGSVSIDSFKNFCVLAVDRGINTDPIDRVPVPFTIEPVYQLVIFADYVYKITDKPTDLAEKPAEITQEGRYTEPKLTLETGCHIHNPITNQLEAYITGGFTFGELLGTNAYVEVHPDVQLNITAKYNDQPDLGILGTIGTPEILEADAIARAEHYLAGMAFQYPNALSLTMKYNGIVPIYLDGAIAQVSYEIGGDGASTVASRNTEHHPYVPPYPDRRRAERLPGADLKDRDNNVMTKTLKGRAPGDLPLDL